MAKVRVAEDPERMKLAMRNFLNKEPAKIAMDLQDSLQGNMREIIGTLTLRGHQYGPRFLFRPGDDQGVPRHGEAGYRHSLLQHSECNR